jgi:hypothetical protein
MYCMRSIRLLPRLHANTAYACTTIFLLTAHAPYRKRGERMQEQYQPANQHRAGHSAGLHPEDLDIEEDERYYVTRPHTSTRRYYTPADDLTVKRGKATVVSHYHQQPLRASRQQYQLPSQHHVYTDDIEDEPQTQRPGSRKGHRFRSHWMLAVGIGMLVMIALWVLGSMAVTWWNVTQDDWHYGRPRTFQTDAVVGHNDSASNPSHFIAINLNRHVVIIELPGGDSAKAKIYSVTTLFGDGQDLTPVTLSFKDVNGDGLLDMEIHIQDQTIALLNDNGGFRPPRQGEQIHV